MKKGREGYYKIKAKLRDRYDEGDVALIEPDTGDYFVAATTVEAYKKAHKKYPRRKFFGAKVGNLAFKMK